MQNRLNACDFYVFLWSIYYLQGTLYSEGGMVSMVTLVVLMLISIYHCFKSILKYKLPLYFKGLILLLFFIAIYGVLRLRDGDIVVGNTVVKNYSYLKDHFMSLLPIFVFYDFARQSKINRNRLIIYTYVFLFLAVICFFKLRRDFAAIHFGSVDFTNNSAYMFVQILPLLILSRQKRIVEYIVVAILFLFVILSMKRGALITGIIIAVIAYWSTYKRLSIIGKIGTSFLVVVLLVLAWRFVEGFYLSNEYFRLRIEATQVGFSSGRDTIYGDLLNHFFYETTNLEFLFGSGADSTLKYSTNFAHNDWLEIATTMGILGLFVYLIYWFLFYKTIRRMKYLDPIIKNVVLMIFVFCFIRTIFSMSINDMFAPLTCALGFSLSKLDANKRGFSLINRY